MFMHVMRARGIFRNLLLLKHSGHKKTVLSFSCRVNPHLLATRRPDSETWDVLGILLMLRAGERLLFSSPFINFRQKIN